MQLQAYFSTLGLEGVLEGTFDQELPPQQDTVLDEKDTTQASQVDTRKANAKVMQELVLGFNKPTLVNMIAMSKSKEWPLRKALRVWKTFQDRCVLDYDTMEMSMENELMKLRIQKTKDPMYLDDQIAGVAVKYGCTVEEKEKYKTIVRASKTMN